jgi:hypothetical protein
MHARVVAFDRHDVLDSQGNTERHSQHRESLALVGPSLMILPSGPQDFSI